MALPTLLTVIGNISSGKTTALPFIGQALGAELLYADELFQVSPFRDRYLNDTPRWAFVNELWLTQERWQLTKKSIEQHPGQSLVIDSGLLMSWVYARSHVLVGNMSNDEWNLYDQLFSNFIASIPRSLQVIALSCPIETLLQRIKQRGRDYELEYYTPQYLEQLELGLAALVEKLEQEHIPVHQLANTEVGDLCHSSSDQIEFAQRVSTIFRSSSSPNPLL